MKIKRPAKPREIAVSLVCLGLMACGDAASTSVGGGGAEGGAGGAGAAGGSGGAGGSGAEAGAGGIGGVGGSGAAGAGGSGGAPSCEIVVVPGGSEPSPGVPGEVQILATGQDTVWGTALDDDYLYWTNGADPGQVARVAKTGGPVEQLAVAVDPYAPFLDGEFLYFGDSDETIKRVPKAGGCVETIAMDIVAPSSLAFEADTLYFTDYALGNVGRMSKDGGPIEILATGQPNPTNVVVFGDHVYWLNRAGNVEFEGSLARVAKDGGAPEVIDAMRTVPLHLRPYQDGLVFTSSYITKEMTSERRFRTYDLASGVVTELPDKANGLGLVVQGDDLLFPSYPPAALSRLTPGSGVEQLMLLPERAWDLMGDGEQLYFGLYLTHEFARTPQP